MDGNVERPGSLDQIAGHGSVAPGWDKAARRMVMGNDDGGRTELQTPFENLARVDVDG